MLNSNCLTTALKDNNKGTNRLNKAFLNGDKYSIQSEKEMNDSFLSIPKSYRKNNLSIYGSPQEINYFTQINTLKSSKIFKPVEGFTTSRTAFEVNSPIKLLLENDDLLY